MSLKVVDGKKLMNCLRAVNEPIKMKELLIMLGAHKVSSEERMKIKRDLKAVLKSSLKLGFVMKLNNHYIAATHCEDVAEVENLSSEIEADETSSDEENLP